MSDALWLPLYPALYAAALLLVRKQIREWQGSQWLDGLVASLGAAAVVTALLLTPVMDAATGSGADVAVNLAYPAADLLLLMLIVTVFAVTGWRPGRRWWLLGVGMAFFAVADVVYLVQLGAGSFQPGTWLDDVWLVGVVAMALASWVSSGRTVAAAVTRGRSAAGGAHAVRCLLARGAGSTGPSTQPWVAHRHDPLRDDDHGGAAADEPELP